MKTITKGDKSMRCKKCGTENEEGRYICSNCGSPLYDEDEDILEQESEAEESEYTEAQNQEMYDDQGNNESIANDVDEDDEEDNDKSKKLNTAIIVILVIIVIALIIGVILIVTGGGSNDDETNLNETESISDVIEDEATTLTTTAPQTTQETIVGTTATTRQTTATTTTLPTYTIAVKTSGKGKVSGDGSYESGKKITLTATPSSGYEFDGWYDSSSDSLVASANTYSFTVGSDRSLTAKFVAVTTTTTTEATTVEPVPDTTTTEIEEDGD